MLNQVGNELVRYMKDDNMSPETVYGVLETLLPCNLYMEYRVSHSDC